jgi:cysteine desulfurase
MAAVRPLNRTYLDYNATAPLRPEARQAALAAMETTGNPSSVHAEGREARRIVEEARSNVARLAGVSSRCVTFVSGGTEAANSAINPYFGAGRGGAPLERLIVSAGEHACVLSGHRFPAAEIAPLHSDGRLDLEWLKAACRGPGRALLALQGANNETGVVQPVAEAAALIHAAGGLVFCDAVQMAGRIDCNIAALDADALMFSAHKMGGPKGAGALATAHAGISLGEPLVRGGGQERGARAGTESVAAVAGFGAVALLCSTQMAAEASRLLALGERFAGAVRSIAPDAVIFSETAPRLPNTLCFAVPAVDAATLMIALDLAGVAVSSGSACSSGKVAPSHVLSAMGVRPELARGAIRLSLGWASGEADVERFAQAFMGAITRIRVARGAA